MNLNFINMRKKELGYTNETLSKISGVPLSTISKITAGIIDNPKLSTLTAITRSLKCTLDDLSDFKENDLCIPANENKTDFTLSETNIIKAFRKLNEKGKEKAIEYTTDLLENSKYTE